MKWSRAVISTTQCPRICYDLPIQVIMCIKNTHTPPGIHITTINFGWVSKATRCLKIYIRKFLHSWLTVAWQQVAQFQGTRLPTARQQVDQFQGNRLPTVRQQVSQFQGTKLTTARQQVLNSKPTSS